MVVPNGSTPTHATIDFVQSLTASSLVPVSPLNSAIFNELHQQFQRLRLTGILVTIQSPNRAVNILSLL